MRLWYHPGYLTQMVNKDQLRFSWEFICLAPPDILLATVLDWVMNSQTLYLNRIVEETNVDRKRRQWRLQETTPSPQKMGTLGKEPSTQVNELGQSIAGDVAKLSNVEVQTKNWNGRVNGFGER